ncbi:MAG: hypothetical protein ACRDPY_18585 [Streptosporangiaceae bacterium]
MTTRTAPPRAAASVWLAGYRAARKRFPPRPVQPDWPATMQTRGQVLAQLASMAADDARSQRGPGGLEALLDWLEAQEGDSWQHRWLASGADAAGAGWLQLPGQWLSQRDGRARLVPWALIAAVCGDIVRPSLAWLIAAGYDADLVRVMAAFRDRQGFAQLAGLGDQADGGPKTARPHTRRRAAMILAAKGGMITGITIGDLLELLDTETDMLGAARPGAADSYRLLRQLGIFGPAAPIRLRELRTAGQRTAEEMIDRHDLACRPIRDLLVDYLKERQPAIDYASLEQLACRLGMFWADLEAHHPGIDSLHLSAEVADAWKQRMRTKQTTITTAAGKTVVETERICHREFLTPVRAFYLDLAQWAVDDPARWAQWAVPCPVGRAETIQGKVQRHRKSRMDARTRERLPVLPALVRCTAQQHAGAQELLHAARATRPGATFTAAGTTLARAVTSATAVSVWADDLASGTRRNLTAEEDRAFWAWATVEILRATGLFSAGHPLWRKSDLRVCTAQRLMERR